MLGDVSQSVDYEELRAKQVASAKDEGLEVMLLPHFKAFRCGFPPDSAIVTPRELHEKVALGQVAEGGTPVARALNILDSFIGPYVPPVLRPTLAFNEGTAGDSIGSLFSPSSPRNV
jgi:hypothetical protein